MKKFLSGLVLLAGVFGVGVAEAQMFDVTSEELPTLGCACGEWTDIFVEMFSSICCAVIFYVVLLGVLYGILYRSSKNRSIVFSLLVLVLIILGVFYFCAVPSYAVVIMLGLLSVLFLVLVFLLSYYVRSRLGRWGTLGLTVFSLGVSMGLEYLFVVWMKMPLQYSFISLAVIYVVLMFGLSGLIKKLIK